MARTGIGFLPQSRRIDVVRRFVADNVNNMFLLSTLNPDGIDD
jgi:hypothetical protein